MANRPVNLTTRTAPHQDSVAARPKQPSGALIDFHKSPAMDTKAEVDAFITASANRPPQNDLYDRINFIRTGRRTPLKPSAY